MRLPGKGVLLAAVLAGGCFDEGQQRPDPSRVIHLSDGHTVLSPNGGEVWGTGVERTITWRSPGGGSAVRIELLRGGALCTVLADGVPNNGSYPWWCQSWCENAADYSVRVIELPSGRWDDSDGVFTISNDNHPCIIEVSEPTGSGTWTEGQRMPIVWESRGVACGDLVMIELLHGQDPCAFVTEATENGGLFEWTVQACTSDSGGYAIRVTDLATWSYGVSQGSITIVPAQPDPCGIEVLAPNGGEEWIEGEIHSIEWDHTGVCDEWVRIELVNERESLRAVIAEGVPNSGIYSWQARRLQKVSIGYTIRVTEPESGAVDESDGTFAILSHVQLALIAPNGGEGWLEGQSYAILWQSSAGAGDVVDLDLLLDGQVCGRIAAGVPNTGSHTWAAEQHDQHEGEYAVRVTDPATGGTDESDATFRILGPCEIAVLVPNGAESWAVGEPYPIGWDPAGACGAFVRIELLHDGVGCQIISPGAPNTGTYVWDAAQCGGLTSGYKVRVTDLESGATDASDGSFAIHEPCAVTVTAPASREVLIEGTTGRIAWLRSGSCENPVRIDLVQAGAVCRTIAASIANSGEHTWAVERCTGTTSGYRIRITDLGTGVAAESPGAFTILSACSVRLQAPNGGEAWVDGREEAIRWLPSGACSDRVDIELLRDGVLCRTIARAAPNTGSYVWRAEQVSGRAAGYTIRITEPVSGARDQSYGPFSILEGCRMELAWPDGGEVWVSGGQESIGWDATATCGDWVRIDLLLGGGLCRTIASATPNDGRHDWQPQACGGSAGYRIVLTDLATLAADTSSASFEIRAAVYLRFSVVGGGWSVQTNHPPWAGRVDLAFDASGTHGVGCPDWYGYGCDVLILDPDGDRMAGFHPNQTAGSAAGRGLEVDGRCRAVEVRLTGCSEEASGSLGLKVTSSASGGCQVGLPVAAELRTMSAQFQGSCAVGSAPVRFEVVFTDSGSQNRTYAVREVEYVFHGWPAP